MNDLLTASPMTACSPAPPRPTRGRRLWQHLQAITPLLTAADAQALDAIAVQREVAAGDWVFTHMGAARSLVLLQSGTVSLGHSDGAPMAPEFVLHGPAWIDAASAWRIGATHALDARALTLARVAELPRAEVKALLLQRPALAPGLLSVLAEEVQRLSLHTHELMHKDASSRLAAWLHRHSQSAPGATSTLHLSERKRNIAAQLGMSPETLSRQMRLLSQRGLIEVRGYHVLVRDSDGLHRLAQG
jgi:CRP/FNR family transcriptional regulator, dissimilatory nitrate respiration regulator